MMRHVEIPLLVSGSDRRRFAGRGEPVTGGVPVPRGIAHDTDRWTLVTADGAPLPVQTIPTDHWPDGSIRWLLVDTQASIPAGATAVPLSLRLNVAAPSPGLPGMASRAGATKTTIDAGRYTFHLNTGAPAVIESVVGPDGQLFVGTAAEIRVIGTDGERWRVEWHHATIESEGPVRVSTMTEGSAIGPGGRTLALFMRLEFFSGHPVVRIRLTIRNQQRAAHPGGIWELGDAGSLLLQEVSIVLPASGQSSPRLLLSAEPGNEVEGSQRVSVYQESSGGENWSSSNHQTQQGTVPFRFRGYRMDVDGTTSSGLRATPLALLADDRAMLGAVVPEFWQNFPRAISATPAHLQVSFFPPDAPALHELQGGEQKTHECYVCFAPDTVTDPPLEWCRTRAVLHATPQWCAESAAIPNMVTAEDEDAVYRALAGAALDGPDTFERKREVADEFGWRHFGDIYGDHEAVKSATLLISHYNNQYDPVAGFLYQFVRTGDRRWWDHCAALASHVADIDTYHTNADRPAYNHGLFWHTIHYVDAGKSTHRSYPHGTVGGGPSCEHNYPTGLMLHYFVTGDVMSRDTSAGLARFVIDIDDGSGTPFKYLARGNTGYASASRSADYHGPGRGSGNSLNALVDGHRLTGERVFLEKAEQLIRRCTHPRQDIDRLTLLDPENRWFYTMYMQSLGKYLHWKVERDELDAMYAYGRDVLLHFARWMADHERPYLDRPELLEFPTETWGAQDIRKSEIFDLAARHASGGDVARFTERAEFFFRYSVDTLTSQPTRALARPVVLMLVHGTLRAHARKNGVVAAPPPREDWASRWPEHEMFVPQKARAVRRMKQIIVVGAAALAAAAALLIA
jgi:hypothetical protein